MILPELPAKLDKRANQINKFLGLNWTENYTVGELRDSIGLTSENYPCLSQRLGISKSDDFTDVTDIFEYSNNLVTVSLTGEDEYTLHINGDPITTVDGASAGAKQFAILGDRLIVWPDGIIVESDYTVKLMSDDISVPVASPLPVDYSPNAYTLGITDNSLTTTYVSAYTGGPNPTSNDFPVGTNVDGVYLYCYGTDQYAVQACFKDGAWDLDALNLLKRTVAINYDPVSLDSNEPYADYPCPVENMIIVLDSSGKVVPSTADPPDESKYRTDGKYFKVNGGGHPCDAYISPILTTYMAAFSSINMYTYADTTSTVLTTVANTDVMYYAGNANNSNWAYLKVTKSGVDYVGYCERSKIHLRKSDDGGKWTGLECQSAGVVLFDNKYFHGGYKINIKGTKYGLYDKENLSVVSSTANRLTFESGTFQTALTYCFEVTNNAGMSAGQHTFKAGSNYYTVTTTSSVPKGYVLYIRPKVKDAVYVWNPTTKTVVTEYAATVSNTWSGTYDSALPYLEANPGGTVVITKVIPGLDYICESNNRLWGVSNDDKTIYASALGDPTDWWSTGFDDGSYQLAVASEDPFTAIVEYGNAVLAWKEYSVTKVMGSYPSQYYSAEYQYAGVQDGAHDCVRAINGVLFYKGVHGFYAYQSTPNLISDKLGDPMLYGTHAGSDGNRYYCCVNDGDSGYSVLVYDLSRGIWLKESEDKVDGYIYDSAYKVCGFISGGDLFYYDRTSTERVEWKAEFCPFIEGTTSNSVYTVLMGKKGYTRLIVFADMAENSFIKMEIKEDNKPWREIGTKKASYPILFRQPIRLGRCAKVALKISGRGRVMIKAITREYLAGSDR